MEEELLEPVARSVRFRKGLQHINERNVRDLVDLGCGPKTRFFFYAKKRGYKINNYIGIDPLLSEENLAKAKGVNGISLMKAPLDTSIPLPDASTDYVVGFAFLEHIDHPQEIIREAVRILRPGGKAVFTAPSLRAKDVLEFLSYRLKVISEREIREHKTYFTKELTYEYTHALSDAVDVTHEYFELGLNNLIILQKKSV